MNTTPGNGIAGGCCGRGTARCVLLGCLLITGAMAALAAPKPKTMIGLTLSPNSATLRVGETQAFASMAEYTDGSTADVTAQANYFSSRKQIATIDNAGVALGIGPGTVTITARLSSFKAESVLTVTAVNQPPVAQCRDVTVNANESCLGVVTPADVDNGSYDPEGAALTLSLQPPGPYPPGGTPVTLTVTDPLGASRSCGATITVQGSPQAYYRDADGDGCGNTADSVETCLAPAGYVANATDCDDANAAVHPGAAEACNGVDDDCDGQTDEGFSDYDNDGVADCLDPPPNHEPEARCRDVMKVADGDCRAEVMPADVDNGSNDPDGDPITLTLLPAGPFALGVTPVTLWVTDDEGASSTCTATVTVVDATPPTLSCPSDITVTHAPGETSVIVHYAAPVAGDMCSAVSVTCDPPAGSAFPIGATPVTATAIDAAGNRTPCTFTVTVRSPNALFINPAGGYWDEPLNWNTGSVPGPTDDVLIDLAGGAAVEYRAGDTTVRSLAVSSPLTLSGGSLTVLGAGTFAGPTRVEGALLAVHGGVRLGATLTLHGEMVVEGGLTLRNATLVLNDSEARCALLHFLGTQTLGGTGDVRFDGDGGCSYLYAQGDGTEAGAATLTIGAGIIVHGVGSGHLQGVYRFDRIIIQGLLVADAPGQTLAMSGRWENDGILRVANDTAVLLLDGTWINRGRIESLGGSLVMGGTWVNAGTIDTAETAVTLTGTLTTAQLGEMHTDGGVVYLSGLLDNRGDTLELSAETGDWYLQGGAIMGGTVAGTDEAQLRVNGWGMVGSLSDVTLACDVTVQVWGTLVVRNGLELRNSALVLNAAGVCASVVFAGTQTLDGNGEVLFEGETDCASLAVRGDGTQRGGATLTIGPGITVHGSNSGILQTTYTYDTLINRGTVVVDAPGREIEMIGCWENAGMLRAAVPTSRLLLDGVWINRGDIVADGGELVLRGCWCNAGSVGATVGTLTLGGGFTTAQLGALGCLGGAVRLTGVLDNTGVELAIGGAGGVWQLAGGEIVGGRVVSCDGAPLRVAGWNAVGRLTGVTLGCDALVEEWGTLEVRNGLTLDHAALVLNAEQASATVAFVGTQALGGQGEVRFEGDADAAYLYAQGSGSAPSPATLVLGPDITVHGSNSGHMSGVYAGDRFVNQGLIVAEQAGQIIRIGASDFTHEGAMGGVTGGRINIAVGTFAMTSTAVLSLDLGGYTPGVDYGAISISGTAVLDGTLDVGLANGFVPNIGDAFPFMTYATHVGGFATLLGQDLGVGKAFQAEHAPADVTLTVVAAP